MVERRLTGMIAAAAVLIVLFVFWDVFRPAPHRGSVEIDQPQTAATQSATPPATQAPPPPPPPPPPTAQAPVATTTTEGSAGAASAGGGVRQPTYFDLLARSETRRRIRLSGNSTYLGDMLAASDDSMLRRWDNRIQTPVRVWFASTHAANFKPAFLDQIRAAFGEWVNAGVPVRFDFVTDSTEAEVTVKWRIQFEIERTGQTDVTWDDQGHIQSAVVTLATFDPKGRPMEPEDIRVVATHEVGHVLGLDHSKDSTDIMFPMAKVRSLSDRDVRTAQLLYELTPGSVR
jgi:predicted Zn-dependent protease